MRSIWQKQSGGTVSQQVPYISVIGCLFSPAEQHFFSVLQYLVMRGIEKAGQFSNCPTVFDCFFVKRS